MYLPLMFHHIFLIGFYFFIRKKLKKHTGSKKERNALVISWFFRIMTVPIVIDLLNYSIIIDEAQLVRLHRDYKKLDESLKEDFKNCILSLGVLSYSICPRLYGKEKSLLVSSNENLSKRLNRCYFGGHSLDYSIEDGRICDRALLEVGEKGSKEDQIAVLERIVSDSKDVSCSYRWSYYNSGISHFQRIEPEVIKRYIYEQLVDHNCKGFLYESDRRSLFFDPYFMSLFNDRFSLIDFSGLSDDTIFNWKASFLDIRFSIDNKNAFVLGSGDVPIIVTVDIYNIYHAKKRNQLSQYRKAIRKFLEIEMPQFVEKYPYSYLEDTRWVEKRIRDGSFDPNTKSFLGYKTLE